ncbi:hypothetical protein AAMO2058_000069900 [Amorphochlora amoebiformis]
MQWVYLSAESIIMLTLTFSLATYSLLRTWMFIDEPPLRKIREEKKRKNTHIVMLGDSTLDNKRWVGTDPSVCEHIQWKLKSRGEHRGWKVSDLSVDGYMIKGLVDRQLPQVPRDATHLIISIGGNNALCVMEEVDALGHWKFLPPFLLYAIYRGIKKLKREYDHMLAAALTLNKPIIVCTLYHPGFGLKRRNILERPMVISRSANFFSRFINSAATKLNGYVTRGVVAVGVEAINYGIIRTAARSKKLPIIDLAAVFNDANDYANPIEPSGQGGDKISQNILFAVLCHDFSGPSRKYDHREISNDGKYPRFPRKKKLAKSRKKPISSNSLSGSSGGPSGSRSIQENNRFRA